jgi:hypothetical protein
MIDQKRKDAGGGGGAAGGGSGTKSRPEKSEGRREDSGIRFGKELGALQHDAQILFESLARTGDGLTRSLEEQLQARPLAVLGVAAGVGYILGGGLPSFVTKTALRMGFRAATSFAVGRILANIAGQPEG